MAGIYVHIPFCKQKCFYCDFYSSTDLSLRNYFLDALLNECEQKKSFFGKQEVSTIYIGGGTPSLMDVDSMKKILEKIRDVFLCGSHLEVTIEVNPDDIDLDFLKELKLIGFNRLSIGIQSFNDNDLQLMNRRHTSYAAQKSVEEAKKIGFDNISIDLIYGIPNMSIKQWENNLKKAFSLGVQHLSAYHLTIEEGTIFYRLKEKGKLSEIEDKESEEQFKLLIDYAKRNKFQQYEISNFALDGMYSKHNSNYWFQEAYLGLGPSAHSYDLSRRGWNASDLHQYKKQIDSNELFFECEVLSLRDRYNDYIITQLRTMWGIDLSFVEKEFGKIYFDFCTQQAETFYLQKLLAKKGKRYFLEEKGKFISDTILRELIYVEN